MRYAGQFADFPIFDPTYYLREYDDLLDTYGAADQDAAKQHWLNHGINEGRRGSLFFDPTYYLNQNKDVAQAVGSSNYAGAIRHWLNSGLPEGRRGSEEFDPSYYLQANSDVANAYGHKNFEEGIRHFLLLGESEGRQGRSQIQTSRQHLALQSECPASIKKLILFFVPGHEFISGGILSIFSLNLCQSQVKESKTKQINQQTSKPKKERLSVTGVFLFYIFLYFILTRF